MSASLSTSTSLEYLAKTERGNGNDSAGQL